MALLWAGPAVSLLSRSIKSRQLPRLLVLGGTGEAIKFVGRASDRFGGRLSIIVSLAGKTRNPAKFPCEVRRGGFGGVSGLADWIADNGVNFVVDATHPFAVVISENARLACEKKRIQRLVLGSSQWIPHANDRWFHASDAYDAARLVPKLGRRPFLSVGSRDIDCFTGLETMKVVIRLIDEPNEPLPLKNYELVKGRGPFELEAEKCLLKEYEIDVIVAKNSGGSATYAKILAARLATIPVIMIERPPPVVGEYVECIDQVVSWIEQRLN